jgi:uncharacterized protein (TIGR02145 family)
LPSDAEWDVLLKYVQEDNGAIYVNLRAHVAGKYLKAVNGWNYNGQSDNSEDKYCFSAFPGESGYDVIYVTGPDSGFWWSSSEDEDYSNKACLRDMHVGVDNVLWGFSDKSHLFSVRCVQD